MRTENDLQLLKKYQKVLADAQMGLWEWDFASEYLKIDQGIRSLYGHSQDISELLLKDCKNSIHPEDLDAVLDYAKKASTGHFEHESLFRFISIEKKIKYIRSRAQQVRNANGDVIGLMGLSWDVTEQITLQKEKEKADSQFQLMISLIDSSADLFGFSDKSGVPIYINKAGQDIYGIRTGKGHFADYIAKKDQQYIHETVIPQLRANQGWEGEVLTLNPQTQDEIPVWLRIFSIQVGPKKEDLFYACSGSDLRKIKAIQHSLISQSKMAALGEMAAEMAHEINNPLMIVQVKSQMIQDRLTSGIIDLDKLIADLKLIEKNSYRIQKIVHSSKAISRNAEMDPYTNVSILTLIDEAFEIFKERFIKKQLQLELKVQEGITYDDMIEARGSEILQVFVNLLNNSYDAIRNQANAGWVKFQLSKVNDKFEIQVLDSGDKIPKDIADKMMDPFFTTKPTGQGTGLGLSLSRQIIENHKGTLFYDSGSPNTRFVLALKKKLSEEKRV